MPLGFAFQGVASKLGFRDKSQLKLAILVDRSVLRTGRNHSKRVVWCKFGCSSHEMILSLFVAGAGLCAGFEGWKCDSRGRPRES